MATTRKVVTVTVFDGELNQGGTAWPDMTNVEIGEKTFERMLRRAKNRAESSGEYEDGDVITVCGWDENGHLAEYQSVSLDIEAEVVEPAEVV